MLFRSPDYADAHYNRGIVLQVMKHPEAAVLSFDRAIALRPDYAAAWWNKSLTLLQNGRFAAGLPLYEWRWKLDKLKAAQRVFPQPLWLGNTPIAGKTVLLHSEQGLGDTLQFCRFAPLVAARGARVLLQVQAALVPLLQGLEGVSEVIAEEAVLPAFDCHCPLLSLPLALGTTLDTIPRNTPYLKAEPARLREWAARLGERRAPRVGLVWSGNPLHPNDRRRSLALANLFAWGLDALQDEFEFISLQKDVPARDRAFLEGNTALRHFGEALRDFGDTAALCGLLDLVVCVDTSVAHLAGALGRPVWTLLPHNADWRWLLDRDDSPWYPGMRLMRQRRTGDWQAVIGELRQRLRQEFGSRKR